MMGDFASNVGPLGETTVFITAGEFFPFSISGVICVEAAAILTGIMCIHIYNYVKCLI
jgi:hypothetical protein